MLTPKPRALPWALVYDPFGVKRALGTHVAVLGVTPKGSYTKARGKRSATLGTHVAVLGETPKGLYTKARGKRSAALGTHVAPSVPV